MTKNKIKTFLFVAFCCGTLSSFGQTSKSSLGLSGGYVPEGFGVEASYVLHTNLSDFIKISALATFAKENSSTGVSIPYNDYLLNIGYYSSLYKSPTSGISLSVGGGASIGYENVNNGESLLSDGSVLTSQSGFVYGLSAGTDFDLFLNDTISLFVPSSFIYQFNSDLGGFIFYIGLGLRYTISQ